MKLCYFSVLYIQLMKGDISIPDIAAIVEPEVAEQAPPCAKAAAVHANATQLALLKVAFEKGPIAGPELKILSEETGL